MTSAEYGPDGGDPVVELTDVEVSYSASSVILKDVNLTVNPGEVVGVTGATGSGKTTLLYTICGVIPSYVNADVEGAVRVFGQEMTAKRLPTILKDVGFLFQDPESQLFNLLVRDELVWGLENRGIPPEQMHEQLMATAAFLNLEEHLTRITYDLSGGEKQRVALGAAYVMHPKLFLLDDPTSQLDPVGTTGVLAGIRALAEEGRTIVLADQNLDELLTIVDRLVVLADNRISFDGPVSEVLARPEVLERAGIRLPELLELRALLAGRDGVPPLSVKVSDWTSLPPPAAQRVASTVSPEAAGDASEAPVGEAKLTVRSLDFSYPPPRDVPVLKNVDVDIPAGQVVALLGRNGSGKTTLARCLSGHLAPKGGTVAYEGIPLREIALRERVQRVGYVFQNPRNQVFKDPLFEDVAFGPRNLGWPEDEVRARVEEVLKSMRLWEKAALHPYELSNGEMQRLAIASVLVMQPEVLIVDEPTTGQDPQQAFELLQRLVEWTSSREGNTLVIITHAMDLTAAFADWTVVMSNGEVAFTGPPTQLFASEGEVLRAMHLSPPPVFRVTQAWGWEPPALTVREATAVFEGVAQGGDAR